MSHPSQWPLPPEGVRFITPAFMVRALNANPLARDCYPTAMGYYPQAKGHRMQRQRHDDNLLLYCVAGRGVLRCGEDVFRLKPGQIAMLPQGLAHHYRADRRKPWSLYWIHFQGSAAAVFLNYLGYREGAPVLDVGVSPALRGSLDSLLVVRQTGYSTSAFVHCANHLRYLLTLFAQERRSHQARQGLDLPALTAYMRENIARQLSLENLAEVANLSKYYFVTRYKALTGYPPLKHFTHMKMEYACQLLDSTDMSIQAVAEAVGYNDPLYFSRLFRKTLGQSPRGYRAAGRG